MFWIRIRVLALTPFFETLWHARNRLPFCGAFYREALPLLEPVEQAYQEKIPGWSEVLSVIFGEMLMDASPKPRILPLSLFILKKESPLSGVNSAELAYYARCVMTVGRHFCERHWLDWLEDRLERLCVIREFIEDQELVEERVSQGIRFDGFQLGPRVGSVSGPILVGEGFGFGSGNGAAGRSSVSGPSTIRRPGFAVGSLRFTLRAAPRLAGSMP